MDKLSLIFFALFLACLAATQESAKKKHIRSVTTFALLAAICFALAVVFLLMSLIGGYVE